MRPPVAGDATILCCTRSASSAATFVRSPDRAWPGVHATQVHLASTGISWPALKQTACALRFFYGVTLGRASSRSASLARGSRASSRLLLNADEVLCVLGAVPSLDTGVALTTSYGGAAGVRGGGSKVAECSGTASPPPFAERHRHPHLQGAARQRQLVEHDALHAGLIRRTQSSLHRCPQGRDLVYIPSLGSIARTGAIDLSRQRRSEASPGTGPSGIRPQASSRSCDPGAPPPAARRLSNRAHQPGEGLVEKLPKARLQNLMDTTAEHSGYRHTRRGRPEVAHILFMAARRHDTDLTTF